MQKCQRPGRCSPSVPLPLLSSGSWDGGRSADTARSTNKQTNRTKKKKLKQRKREQMKRGCVCVCACGPLHPASLAHHPHQRPPWGPVACSSHYSPECPLPPIGCDNAAWQGCQCRVISRLCFTAPTTRATSQQDGVSLFPAPQAATAHPHSSHCGHQKVVCVLISLKTFYFVFFISKTAKVKF